MQQSDLHRLIQSLETKGDALTHNSRQWREKIDDKTKEIEELKRKRKENAQRINELRDTAQNIQTNLQNRQEQQQEFEERVHAIKEERIHSQCLVTQAESEWRELKAAHDLLATRYEAVRPSRDCKCAGCSKCNIEFAMLPCFHFECAKELSSCKICKSTKQGIQRIYYG
ncbi:hypothetical protein O0I10_008093 [Lichtheimia ornata]|uniref:Uncharacterized protein n=1 Tax=Lichtheimia ornata TaxID=688661 RepID=A0AAD7XTE6_9FUNG|nr:uncharacterized protein O0I10_008093 [Lichtheimia ornata]KAJ8656299.1 hypothetical protein O0I10_008093 [Lichtheimia ornata]